MATRRTTTRTAPVDAYVDRVLDEVRQSLVESLEVLARAGSPIPEPDELADLLRAGLPTSPGTIDPHFADVGPFYDSKGAQLQLGGVTKQAVDSRRTNGSVLAMRTGDGHWLYPAWQFSGQGGVHQALVPVLKALKPLDRWAAGVWLVSAHPDLDGRSPREALRDGADPELVTQVARHDTLTLTA